MNISLILLQSSGERVYNWGTKMFTIHIVKANISTSYIAWYIHKFPPSSQAKISILSTVMKLDINWLSIM